jgi:beta-carotene hydroxylase
MQLRHARDRRTLIWSFVLFPLLPCVQYAWPHVAPWLLPLNLYLAYSVGVLMHYHNHRAVFVERSANSLYSLWLSVFYGAPAFGWIPTHNQNHHRHTNGPLDDTRTWRYSDANTAFNAGTYPLVSARFQVSAMREYVRRVRTQNPGQFRRMMAQVAVIPLVHAALLALAVSLHHGVLGLEVYFLAFGGPALFAPWAMMFTNYVQHVHCDPSSPHDHSRNFVDPLMNWFVFDAGYHTVHHDAPGVHWSRYRELHALRARDIDPSLNEHSIFVFCWKNYVVGLFTDRYRTEPLATTEESRPPRAAIRAPSRAIPRARTPLARSVREGVQNSDEPGLRVGGQFLSNSPELEPHLRSPMSWT